MTKDDWIDVKTEMPREQKLVIAAGKNVYDKWRRIRAMWISKHSLDIDDCDYEGDADYDEDKDIFYWPEGWYETNECEDTNWFVNFPILFWQPLPPPPEEK